MQYATSFNALHLILAQMGRPPQDFHVISAAKARRFGPVILDAARRKSVMCDGLRD
jgi:hypothetical protein